MKCTRRFSSALTLSAVIVTAAGCAGGRSASDDLARVMDDLALRAGTAADDGARVGGRQVPPAPSLLETVNARARNLVLPHVTGLDAADAEKIIRRACALRDAALPLTATVQDPERAVEQALAYAVGQLEQPLEVRARDLATSLVEATTATEVVQLLAGAAVCGP